MAYKLSEITEEEADLSFTAATTFTNRFQVNDFGDAVRIAFGDQRSPKSPVNYRAAFMLSKFQAMELKIVLDKVLEGYSEEFDAILARAQKSTDEKGGMNG